MDFKKTDTTKGILTTEQVIFMKDLLSEKETLEARLKEVDESIAELK